MPQKVACIILRSNPAVLKISGVNNKTYLKMLHINRILLANLHICKHTSAETKDHQGVKIGNRHVSFT